jgi:enoyl-CoA hydratase
VSDELRVTADGAVRIVTINRPDDLNVVNATLHHQLLDVWRDLERDSGARCVVLTGAGKTFSGGGDFAFLKAQHRSLGYRYDISAQAVELGLANRVTGPETLMGQVRRDRGTRGGT